MRKHPLLAPLALSVVTLAGVTVLEGGPRLDHAELTSSSHSLSIERGAPGTDGFSHSSIPLLRAAQEQPLLLSDFGPTLNASSARNAGATPPNEPIATLARRVIAGRDQRYAIEIALQRRRARLAAAASLRRAAAAQQAAAQQAAAQQAAAQQAAAQQAAAQQAAAQQAAAQQAAAQQAATAANGVNWYRLRVCESGDNYADNTGNGYYGAYQFALSTWWGLGFSGLPSAAPPAVQNEAAAMLEAENGWAPWPTCSVMLGL